MSDIHKNHATFPIITLIVWALISYMPSVALADPDDLRIEPDPQVQGAFETMGLLVSSDPVDFYRQALALRATARNAETLERLMRQAVYFATRPDNWTEASRPIAFRRFVFLTEIGRVTEVNALAPLVDSSDVAIRRFVIEDVLGGVDLESDSNVDFTALSLFASYHPGKFSPTLVDIAYRQSPSKAVPLLTGVFHTDKVTTEQFIFADRAVQNVLFRDSWNRMRPDDLDEAVRQLQSLMKSKAWWVRRYVAEIVWRYSIFHRGGLVELLMADTDPRIVQATSRPKPQEIGEP